MIIHLKIRYNLFTYEFYIYDTVKSYDCKLLYFILMAILLKKLCNIDFGEVNSPKLILHNFL